LWNSYPMYFMQQFFVQTKLSGLFRYAAAQA
jgi:hypothetical protein